MKYYSKSLILLSGLSLILSNNALSQSRIYVNEYLNIGVGARGLGMSGAVTATTDDVYSGYWNPAGLLNIKEDAQVGLMHAQYFGGVSAYDFGAIAIPTKNKNRVFAFSFIRFATDDIPYTIDYIQPDGSFDESKLKGYTAGDYAGILSFAQKVNLFKKNPSIITRIGGNAKVIYRNVGSMASAWGVGIDLGGQMDYKKWKFGFSIKDITTTYTSWSFNLTDREKQVFGETGNEIPIKSSEVMNPRFNFGVAYEFTKPQSNITVLGELGWDITTDGKRNTILSLGNTLSLDPKVGIQADYKEFIYLRAGIGNFYKVLDNSDIENEKKYTVYQPSIGVGFRIKQFAIDYSFTNLQLQSSPLMSHIVSLRLDLQKNKAKEVSSKEKETNINNN